MNPFHDFFPVIWGVNEVDWFHFGSPFFSFIFGAALRLADADTATLSWRAPSNRVVWRWA
jgi:hypothetical protein